MRSGHKVRKIIFFILIILSAVGTVIVYRLPEHQKGCGGTYICKETGDKLTVVERDNVTAVFKEGSDTESIYGDMYFLSDDVQSGEFIFDNGSGSIDKYGIIKDGTFILCDVDDYYLYDSGSYNNISIYRLTGAVENFKKAAVIVFPVLLAVFGILLMCSCVREHHKGRYVCAAVIYTLLAVTTLAFYPASKVSGMYRSNSVKDANGDYAAIDMYVIEGDETLCVSIGCDDWAISTMLWYVKDDENNVEVMRDGEISDVLYKIEQYLVSDLSIGKNYISMFVGDKATNYERSEIIVFRKQHEASYYVKWIVVIPAAFALITIMPMVIKKKSVRNVKNTQFKHIKQVKNTETIRHRIVYRITEVEFICSGMDYMRSYLERNQIGMEVIVTQSGLIFNGMEVAGSMSDRKYVDSGMMEYAIKTDEDGIKLVIYDGENIQLVYRVEREINEK